MQSVPRTVGGRNVSAKPYRKAFFGVGNYIYPRSRLSIGLWAVDSYAKKRRYIWEKNKLFDTCDYIDCALIRPTAYFIEENGYCFEKAANYLLTSYDRCIIVHYNSKSTLGEITLNFGGRCEDNIGLQSIFDKIGTENFARLSIGVAQPPDKEIDFLHLPIFKYDNYTLRSWYLLSKFPPLETDLFEFVLLPEIHNLMEKAFEVSDSNNYFQYFKLSYRELVAKFQSEIHYKLDSGLITKEQLHQRRLNPWTTEI